MNSLINSRIVNASLTDSDMRNRRKILLKEAIDTLNLGETLGVKVVCNEEDSLKR